MGTTTPHDAERGAGTVLVLGLAAVVLMLGLALAALGAAQRARGAAQSAADLGALAAATALRDGLDPCATATDAVGRNHGLLAECEPGPGGVVGVTVTRAVPAMQAWVGGEARARARAGPRVARISSG
ncbi:Rv3654c family TadE-like protein [Xylanimonas sp. McL0601]|uniref:Rv3654c family TadE-like protein n=1 Tax=Xylanimonas sp. McL0601 TaxID=3414739 RepID=UPI003CF45F2E